MRKPLDRWRLHGGTVWSSWRQCPPGRAKSETAMNERLFDPLPNTHRPVVDAMSANGRLNSVSSRRRILLVDDDPAIGRAMTILFEMAGYALDVATTPDEAYSRLAAARYDA